MSLAQHGLKEIIRKTADNYSASLYIKGQRILAWAICRRGSAEIVSNYQLQLEGADVTPAQAAQAKHWLEDQRKYLHQALLAE